MSTKQMKIDMSCVISPMRYVMISRQLYLLYANSDQPKGEFFLQVPLSSSKGVLYTPATSIIDIVIDITATAIVRFDLSFKTQSWCHRVVLASCSIKARFLNLERIEAHDDSLWNLQLISIADEMTRSKRVHFQITCGNTPTSQICNLRTQVEKFKI